MTDLNTALFGENRYFTLPPGADFLGAIAATLIDVTGAKDRPEALTNTLIFVPNRRSARALAGRLFQALPNGGYLPPDIRPLGDAGDNDTALIGELAAVDARPTAPRGVRLGALTKLVLQWYDARGDNITLASAHGVAKKLASLLDQAALAGDVDWKDLSTLVERTDLAHHWEISTQFLSIVSEGWPDFLEENGYSDTNAQDHLAAEALCARWEREPPDTPVLIAGSTGSAPATRMLMAAAAKLPCGAVVLPGFDTGLDGKSWDAVLAAPSHPQHSLAETVKALGVGFKNIQLWPGFNENKSYQPRRKLIQEALAPANVTADWVDRLETRATPLTSRDLTEQGLEGLALIEAENETEEAEAIAVLLREVVQTEGKTAALVTPDAGLGRRVSAIMSRWGVRLEPSAGIPLLRSRSGGFLLRVLDLVLDSGDPVAIAAFLKHELSVFLTLEDRTKGISAFERTFLRGLKRWDDFTDLCHWVEHCRDNIDDLPNKRLVSENDIILSEHLVIDIEARMGAAFGMLQDMIRTPFELRPFIEAFAELCDRLSKPADEEGPSLLWSGEDGAASARFLEDLASMGDWFPDIQATDLRPLFMSEAETTTVPPIRPGHPVLNIWGPLEARLQTCDLMILGGLNEGVWPVSAGSDGFLPRHMRVQIGLPDTETTLGLSAHDFAQLASTPNVVMTRAKRVDNKPSVASRWLWRLRILASGALDSLDKTDQRLSKDVKHILDWVRAMPKVEAKDRISVQPPAPTPPVKARPRKINVTEVTKLIRDPYGYYAKNILKLRALDPIGKPLGASEIGTAIHKGLEDKDTLDTPSLSTNSLVASFENELEKVGGDALFFMEREGLWQNAANAYLGWMTSRDAKVETRYFESFYKADFELASGTVTLIGRADLVELRNDGRLAITDFKTGKPPTNPQVLSGLEPQLPLLAVIAEKDQSNSAPNAPSEELFYFSLGSKAGVESRFSDKMPAPKLMDEAETGFRQLMENYFQPTQPYLSGPRVQFLSKYSDYDRLARKDEWADAGQEFGGEG